MEHEWRYICVAPPGASLSLGRIDTLMVPSRILTARSLLLLLLRLGEDEESRNILDELQFGPPSSRSSMGRIMNGQQQQPVSSSSRPAGHHHHNHNRTGLMMMSSTGQQPSSQQPQPPPHYQLPPTSHQLPGHHHHHYAANNKAEDVDEMEADLHGHHVPTTLLKRTPSGALFIPSGNQT